MEPVYPRTGYDTGMFGRLLRSALAAALFLSLPSAAGAVAPFAFDTTPGRLPKTVVPTDYRIALVPDAAAKTLRGTENVALDVRRPTARIVFNTHDITISDARLDGTRVAKVTTENDKQLTTLALARPAAVGHHVLALAYAGKIEDSAQGMFAQDYRKPDGTTGRMLSTQFESTDARRVFPSWDEPAFRATYQLTVTLPAAWSAVSNTPVASRTAHGGLQTIAFGRTPKMPSYLVELTAGDVASISGAGPDGVKQSVWAVRGDEQFGGYTLESAEQILAFYDDYFGVKFPLPKLDHIAIPGGFGGAMENWGAITYNENIIIHRADATLGQKQTGYSIVAHEMAHQWNGDLVTMGWWDDIWLNESFASWMAAKATDKFNPDWQWWQGESASKESAMNADARSTVHAIQQHVTDELQADAAFDPAITYDKGQAFLRMLEAYLGEDTFRRGIRTYMRAHAYSNATTADLWNALAAASGKDVGALAKAWTEQPGYPLISVSAACDAAGNRTLALAQKRFLLDGTGAAASPVWNVPVGIASGSGAPAYVMLTGAQLAGVPAGRCGEPLRANAGGIGYYRVAYDAATFETNRKAFASIPDDDKIGMLLDQWALVRVGQAPLTTYLALANAMGEDRNANAWGKIVGALTTLERGTRGTPQHDAVAAYARNLVAPLARSLGWDPKPGDSVQTGELRRTLLGALGTWGDPATLAQARARFERLAADPSAVAPDLRQVVIAIVATNADAATFDKLHALAQSTKEPALAGQYRGALMRVRDPELAQRALQIAISSEVPPQQRNAAYGYVAVVSEWNPKLAWAFFQAHNAELTGRMSAFEKTLGLGNGVPEIFWDAAPPDELAAWLTANLPAGAAPYIAKGIAQARTDGAIRTRLRDEARALAAGGSAAAATKT
jgi:aminopeptidase N